MGQSQIIMCAKCQHPAEVAHFENDPKELAKAGNQSGHGPAPPFFIIACPNCGRRVQEERETPRTLI
jgi:endogenous inhibitor of DNA gyrase (YacG/DUF329 family)